ncbi:DUF484 family protein [Macromonas nakdongensis]|uniref:DUF484 family protein n=1 Tax=Macromonas nakdongensis TaxID=1843082 RepID=UPI000C344D45|nr:DUF484 family protein [Macromonas nakdongensis]
MDTRDTLPPITEDDIAQFLVNTPDFFERHAELLASVQLTSPHGQRAVSLQERQAEMLREKIRHLELKAAEMIRHGHENVVIADRLQAWTLGLLRAAEPGDLPAAVAHGIEDEFQVPQAAIQLWGVADAWAEAPFAQGASAEARAFATSLVQPYCGANPGLEAVKWLARPEAAVSLALLPLRVAAGAPAFGLLVLASDDAQRFTAAMGTDFLERIAVLAAAALSRLLPQD